MDRNVEFVKSLKDRGLRITRQRRLILDVLQESGEHLDASMLYERVREHDPRVGMATVYRTLSLLKELGLVQEHRLGEEHGHFETVKGIHHYHFTCKLCGKVIEFEAPAIDDVVQSLVEREEVNVDEVHLFISGSCATCNGTIS